jgi:hypothetical protein
MLGGLASFLDVESWNGFWGAGCLGCMDSSIVLLVVRLWLVPVTSKGLTGLIIDGGKDPPIRSLRSS